VLHTSETSNYTTITRYTRMYSIDNCHGTNAMELPCVQQSGLQDHCDSLDPWKISEGISAGYK